jgi:hypothetical protein
MPLLSYSGVPGFLLLWSQVLLVSAAILLTAFPRYVPQRWSRVGHALLIGWNALWMLGAWRLALVEPYFLLQATFMTVLGCCTVYRAWRNRRQGRSVSLPITDAQPPTGADKPVVNYFSDEAEQPPSGTPRQQIVQALERGRQAAAAASRKAVLAFKAGINAARDNSAQT